MLLTLGYYLAVLLSAYGAMYLEYPMVWRVIVGAALVIAFVQLVWRRTITEVLTMVAFGLAGVLAYFPQLSGRVLILGVCSFLTLASMLVSLGMEKLPVEAK